MWEGTALGTFERWSRIVGGIAKVAGLDGFLGNVTRLYEESETDEDTIWARLMDKWWLNLNNKHIAAADLIEFDEDGHVTEFGIVNSTIAQGLGLRKGEEIRSLGLMLRARRGRLFGTKQLVRSTTKSNRGILWWLKDTTQ
jgi:hypothetical protein